MGNKDMRGEGTRREWGTMTRGVKGQGGNGEQGCEGDGDRDGDDDNDDDNEGDGDNHHYHHGDMMKGIKGWGGWE